MLNTKLEIRRAWVEALRSGKFKQGKSSLCRKSDVGIDEYCCLGVLCELAEHQGITKSGRTGVLSNKKYYGLGNRRDWNYLPPEVIKWAGLCTQNGTFHGNSTDFDETNLTRLNDSGVSFEEIASTIESEPAGLFVGS